MNRVILDTNTLIRFFVGDEKKQVQQIRTLLHTAENVYIPDVVFPELEYVLIGVYKASREELIVVFQFLIGQANIKTSTAVQKAVELFMSSSLDMADCIIAGSVEAENSLASFDKKLLRQAQRSYWK